MAGAKAVVNVSGNSTTVPRSPVLGERRRRIHRSKRAAANRGTSRFGSTPARRFASPRRVTALATSGASAARRDQTGNQPSE